MRRLRTGTSALADCTLLVGARSTTAMRSLAPVEVEQETGLDWLARSSWMPARLVDRRPASKQAASKASRHRCALSFLLAAA